MLDFEVLSNISPAAATEGTDSTVAHALLVRNRVDASDIVKKSHRKTLMRKPASGTAVYFFQGGARSISLLSFHERWRCCR